MIREVIKFFLRLFVLRKVDDEARDLFFVQSRAKQHGDCGAVLFQEIFFERRTRAKGHQLFKRFFIEPVVLGWR